MRWCLCTLQCAEDILSVTLFTSVTPVLPYTLQRSFMMYIWRSWSSVFADALGDSDRVNSGMLLETGRSSELRYGLGNRDQMSLEMKLGTERSCELMDRLGDQARASMNLHFDTERSIELGDALQDWDRENSELHLEAVIELVGRYTWRW